ncbi:hypothetical protein CSQ85_04270 [Bifidobacterium rousetti]|uniref:DUF4190 domain-containing protein n=1 Tax=Bifidobacterium rousetti TaxID=2045439 RepID=UPI001239651D|nr:DUF4190 domain-containing protein [Bifidobacterium rousetti]KAA8819904.1 hypothetical protein CSQ85_04270 [Bifidobacterium rousetti]
MSDDKNQSQVPFDSRPSQPTTAEETQGTQPLQPLPQQPIQETQPLPTQPAPEEQPTQAIPSFAQQPTSVFPPAADATQPMQPAQPAQPQYPAANVPLPCTAAPTGAAPAAQSNGVPNGAAPYPPQPGVPGAPVPGAPGVPYPPQPNGQQPYYPRAGKWNVCAIIGFILAFLFSLIGLILSIVGLNQIKRTHEKGRGLAIAGIIISIIMMVGGGVGAYYTVSQAMKVASSQSATAKGGTSSDQIGEDLDKGLDELEQDDSAGLDGTGSDGTDGDSTTDGTDSGSDDAFDYRYPSMSEMVADPTFQSEMQSSIGSSFDGTGATVTTRAEGDTLVIDIHLPAQYDAAASELAAQLASTSDQAIQPMADSLPDMVKTTGPAQARMYVHTDAQTIFDKTYTASSSSAQ